MTQHIIELTNNKYREKIEQHLSKHIDISRTIWMINSGTFQKIKFDKITKKITAYNITSLIMSNNQHGSIIKQLGSPMFPYLLILNLSNNCISSAQPLLYFNTPYLEALYLDKNLLTNLKSLRKFIDKNLKILDVSMNQLVDISHITEFNCPRLKQLSLYRNECVTVFQPYVKSNLNPPILMLNKMGFVCHFAKKEYIDFNLRKPLHGQMVKTKI